MRIWRALLLALAAFAAAMVALVLLSENALLWTGDPGWTLQPGAPFVVEVASVTPNGAAARAGVRAGDRIDLRAVSFADRVLLVAAPLASRSLPLEIERKGKRLNVDVQPKPLPSPWTGWIGNLILLWMAAFGALIAWRRPALPEARLLSAGLSCYVAADALQFLTTPSPALDLVFSAINTGGVLGGISLAIFVRFNARFARPLSPARRVVDAVAYAAATALALYGIAGALALGTVWFDPVALYYGLWGIGIICGAQLMVIVSGACAVAASRGFERQRVTWAVVSISILLAATVIEIVLNGVVPTQDMQIATQAAVNVVGIVAPIGLTYSVFSRRLLDVGFALNRAAVFSAVSLVLVGSFMAVEWALGGWLVSAGLVTSTAVSFALALALGFSVRFVHARVDHVVDRVFFRKRHQQEKALLNFAREASFITDAGALLQRAVGEIGRHSETNSVTVFIQADGGAFVATGTDGVPATAVDENDPALVAMRASQAPVDLHRCTSMLRGEYAFPMMSRGVLVGVIVCGPKRSGDAYAPDERDALEKVAHAVGIALDALSRNRGQLEAAVLGLHDEFAALRAEFRSLVDALHADPPVRGGDRPS